MNKIFLLGLALALSFGGIGASRASDSWTRRNGAKGIVYYDCVSDDCEKGALLSCKAQGPNRIKTMKEYEIYRDRKLDALKRIGSRLKASMPTRSVFGSWALYEYDYFMSPRPEFGHVYYRTGYLVSKLQSYTLVSSARDAGAAKRNFSELLSRLASSPAEEALAGCTQSHSTPRVREARSGSLPRFPPVPPEP